MAEFDVMQDAGYVIPAKLVLDSDRGAGIQDAEYVIPAKAGIQEAGFIQGV
ncbi:MAG: hypothetical protein Q8L35_03205 [Actinomycetota bacterium]|nr:hypothetical protein [Actinomycetota bacterium]